MKKNILVFPSSSEIGLEINRSIANSEHFKVIGGSSEDYTNAEFIYSFNFNNFPHINDINFIETLNYFIEKNNIDFIYPAHDLVSLKLSKNINELKCDVVVSEYDSVKICIDKYECYKKFITIINVPQIYDDIKEICSYPVFLKPKIGHGSLGTHIAYNEEEINFYKLRDDTLICMEYLPGSEYTVDCFTDRTGTLRFIGIRERKKIFAGMSSRSIIIKDDRINKIAHLINNNLKLRGAWFFQLKENINGDLALLEIGPRIAGGMDLYRNKGINLPLLSLFDRLNSDIFIIENNYNIEMGKSLECKYTIDLNYDKVYVDLDGTLLIDDKINIQLISFLYQCINRNIKTYLITVHDGDLSDLLDKFRIKSLFDKIIWIKDGEEKYKFIESEGSIFIDNSFNHRFKVWLNKKISVFDVNSIDCLLDHRKY